MPSLNWIGKEKIITHHADVPFRVLEHCYGFNSKCPDSTEVSGTGNKIIHGDNLAALKSLLPEYEGRIDCIYIDPPYNTGKENWCYNDNVNDPHILRWLGDVVGVEGEDLTRHDKWLCMMYPRLVLLSKLLSKNGRMAISIGHHELTNLITICKIIFNGKQVVHVTVQTSGGKPSGGFNYLHEYVVFIVPQDFEPQSLEIFGGKTRTPFEGLTLSTFNQVSRANQVYPIFIDRTTGKIHSVGKSLAQLIEDGEYLGSKEDYEFVADAPNSNCAIVWPITSKGKPCCWRLEGKRLMSDWKKGYIKIVKNRSNLSPNEFSINYLPEGVIKKVESGIIPVKGKEENGFTLILGENSTEGSAIPTIWNEKSFYTVKGTNILEGIFGYKAFDYPKSLEYVTTILDAISDKDDLILDSFGGSGTTAHAVLTLNDKDGGDRHFISVEMLDYAETLTAERVRRVMTGYPYKGKVKEELYRKPLTAANLAKVPQFLAEANSIREANAERFTKIAKPTVKDNAIVVIGELDVDGTMPGLGGGFDFYELGEKLFTDEDTLNENVGEAKIREYIYYSETHQYLSRPQSPDYPYLLDYKDGTGYFFYYKPKELTTLSPETLNIVPVKADHYVIYADICTISADQLAKMNITFKKIPRDINRF